MTEFDIALLAEYFTYDAETGVIRNKRARRGASRGDVSGAPRGHGYCKILFRGRFIYSHRIAWALYYGENPPAIIDHVNGNGEDNAICNLRAATHSQNRQNQKTRRDSHSGLKGVRWHKRASKWSAAITVDSRQVHLGLFASADDAARAYAAAARMHFGEYARIA